MVANPGHHCGKTGNITVIAFPKSGRTWLIEMMRAVEGRNGSYEVTGSHRESAHGHPFLVYDWQLQENFRWWMKTRSSLHPFDYLGCVVVLIRNPMDVLVSSYYDRLYRAYGVFGRFSKLKSNVTLDAYVSKTQDRRKQFRPSIPLKTKEKQKFQEH
eukprot:5612158-Amphidinium_carterae.1